MATPTMPTVPFPTETDIDTDDDDDDISSLLSRSSVATTAPGQTQTIAPIQPLETPGSLSQTISTTSLSDQASHSTAHSSQILATIPTDTTIAFSSVPPNSSASSFSYDSVANSNPTAQAPASDSSSLSIGATVGIGVGVALAVILMAVGVWIFAKRRRRLWQKKRRASGDRSLPGDTPDEKMYKKLSGPQTTEYRAESTTSPVEIGNGRETHVDEKHIFELASPTDPVEAIGDQEYAAELPGSQVPMYSTQKGNRERLFSEIPLDEQDDVLDAEQSMRDKRRLS